MRRWTSPPALRATALAAALLGVAMPCLAAGGRTVRVTLVPERNVFEQERRYAALSDAVSATLPYTVRFEVLKSYRDVLGSLSRGDADGAFMGSFLAAFAVSRYGAVPLVRPEWSNGTTTYASVIFRGKGVAATADPRTWKDRRMVFSDPNTSAGYFLPLAYMARGGVRDPRSFLGSMDFSGSHDTSVWMVAKGISDLGAAKSTVYDEVIRTRPELASEVVELVRQGRYPDSTLMVGKTMEPGPRDALRKAFRGLEATEEGRRALESFGARRFVEAAQDDFDEVFLVVRDAGFAMSGLDPLAGAEATRP